MADYGGAISLSHPPTSDDDDSSDHSLPTPLPSSKPKNLLSASSDIAKKPRGRPPGSKNKPKPPIVITKDNDSAMKPVVIEISAGNDVVETLVQFARQRHVGLSILSGSGSVSNVTLRHPMSHSTSLSLHGPFSLVSLSGSVLADTTPSSSSSKPPTSSSSFGICLAGAQGQVFGGIVGGKVTAASLVVVVAATFLNPVFHRLPIETADDAIETPKPTINNAAADESAAATTTTSSATPMSVCVYSAAASSPDHATMPWGPNSRSSY